MSAIRKMLGIVAVLGLMALSAAPALAAKSAPGARVAPVGFGRHIHEPRRNSELRFGPVPRWGAPHRRWGVRLLRVAAVRQLQLSVRERVGGVHEQHRQLQRVHDRLRGVPQLN
jgi:hypothetical protein